MMDDEMGGRAARTRKINAYKIMIGMPEEKGIPGR
jgi:hypothetical protein